MSNAVASPETESTPTAKAKLALELQILELFGRAGLVVLGPTDVANLTGVTKGAASPVLRAMADAGYLQQAGTGKYQLGPRVFQTAVGYLGVLMGRIDEVRKVLDVDLGQVRAAIEQLSTAMPSVARDKGRAAQ
jgi:hypothetical protein